MISELFLIFGILIVGGDRIIDNIYSRVPIQKKNELRFR